MLPIGNILPDTGTRASNLAPPQPLSLPVRRPDQDSVRNSELSTPWATANLDGGQVGLVPMLFDGVSLN